MRTFVYTSPPRCMVCEQTHNSCCSDECALRAWYLQNEYQLPGTLAYVSSPRPSVVQHCPKMQTEMCTIREKQVHQDKRRRPTTRNIVKRTSEQANPKDRAHSFSRVVQPQNKHIDFSLGEEIPNQPGNERELASTAASQASRREVR